MTEAPLINSLEALNINKLLKLQLDAFGIRKFPPLISYTVAERRLK